MREILVVVLIAIALAQAAHAAECPRGALSSAAADLQDARNALTALSSDKSGDAERAEMRQRLAAFLRTYMRCQPENVDVDGIAVDLARLGWATSDAGGAPSANPAWQLTFKAESFGQGLIGITATFSVPNGTDKVSALFEHGDDGWTQVTRSVEKP